MLLYDSAVWCPPCLSHAQILGEGGCVCKWVRNGKESKQRMQRWMKKQSGNESENRRNMGKMSHAGVCVCVFIGGVGGDCS